MGRRKPKASGARQKKPRVYRRPHHVDRARTLAELLGFATTVEAGGDGLIGRYSSAMTTPLRSMSTREIETLYSQGLSDQALHFLFPELLERLNVDPTARVGGGLLPIAMRASPTFWKVHPWCLSALRTLIGEASEKLAAEPDLESEARYFLERYG